MPDLFIYLIKVNIALLIFCAGYYAVLRHLTFYNLNRVYLVTAIIFSTLYPKINLADFLNRHEEIARPIQVVIVNWQEPVKTIAKTFLGHDIWFWLLVTFWAGVSLFAVRLFTQLLSLYRLHKRSEPAQLHHYMIRVIKGNINPFSFWRNIYINPENHAPQELDAILAHEHIHVSEWHTLDILLGELSAIFYWFNPGVWLMKRAIRENIEFITDNKILKKGVDCKAYQYSLLNVNFGAPGNAIVNHFNISTIKKRIIMMNAKRSSKVNITRYLFLIPAVMVLLLIFSVSKAELKKAVKTSAHMITTFKTVMTKIDLIPSETPTIPLRKKGPLLTAVSSTHIEMDTVPAKTAGKLLLVSDTNKKFTIRLRGVAAGDKEPDIYINGVKTELGLNTINPDNIATINIRKDATAARNGSIYVVTKGARG
jgi:bla regulator protein BlaR1